MSNNDEIRPARRLSPAHTLVPVLVILVGVALLAYMVTVESEPGLIPLLLIASGTTWYLVARARFRSRGKARPADNRA
ncbi:MAG: hypothetical protein ACO1RT_06325 [Planctomycetaceae bacterium]